MTECREAERPCGPYHPWLLVLLCGACTVPLEVVAGADAGPDTLYDVGSRCLPCTEPATCGCVPADLACSDGPPVVCTCLTLWSCDANGETCSLPLLATDELRSWSERAEANPCNSAAAAGWWACTLEAGAAEDRLICVAR